MEQIDACINSAVARFSKAEDDLRKALKAWANADHELRELKAERAEWRE